MICMARRRSRSVFPVSAVTGEGINALKRYLLDAADHCPARSNAGNFRLAIDRCFTIPGAGLVVTGTAVSGSITAGDPVRVLQAGLSVRARTIHAQNAPSKSGKSGQRCALNLVGTGLKDDHNPIRRGDWIVTGDVPAPALRIDARLRILNGEARPLQHWTPVHVHLGAADVTGRVAVLEGSAIAPGTAAGRRAAAAGTGRAARPPPLVLCRMAASGPPPQGSARLLSLAGPGRMNKHP